MAKSNIIWRIDDRLIHGQVIVGWCGQLPIKKIIVCDDEIANTPWEKELLMMAAPPDLTADVISRKETVSHVAEWEAENDAVIVLLKSLPDLQELMNLGLAVTEVNMGGIHFKEERNEILPYLFLDASEIELARRIMASGVALTCQDLPNATSHDLKKLLEKYHD